MTNQLFYGQCERHQRSGRRPHQQQKNDFFSFKYKNKFSHRAYASIYKLSRTVSRFFPYGM